MFNFIHRTRPNMVEMLNCTNVIVESLKVYIQLTKVSFPPNEYDQPHCERYLYMGECNS